MKDKKPIQRLTIADMQARKAQAEEQKALEEFKLQVAEEILSKCNELAQNLVDSGYDVDDFFIETKERIEGDKLVVDLFVSYIGQTLEFGLGGDE